MTYPPGAGPHAGAFTGEPWDGSMSVGTTADGAPRAARPQVLALAADANRVVRFGPPPSGSAWALRRITVQSDATGRAFLYIGEPGDPYALVSGTRSGTFDENEANPPYFVPEGTPVCVVWEAGTPAACVARIEYDEV